MASWNAHMEQLLSLAAKTPRGLLGGFAACTLARGGQRRHHVQKALLGYGFCSSANRVPVSFVTSHRFCYRANRALVNCVSCVMWHHSQCSSTLRVIVCMSLSGAGCQTSCNTHIGLSEGQHVQIWLNGAPCIDIERRRLSDILQCTYRSIRRPACTYLAEWCPVHGH